MSRNRYLVRGDDGRFCLTLCRRGCCAATRSVAGAGRPGHLHCSSGSAYPTCCPLVRFSHKASKMLYAARTLQRFALPDVVTLRPILTFNTISLLYLARQRERLARFAPNKGLTTSPDNLTGDARPLALTRALRARAACVSTWLGERVHDSLNR